MLRTNLVALAALVCLSSGCHSVVTVEDARSGLSPGSVLISVPCVPEEVKGSCGLDCLTSLLRFNHLDIDDEALRRFPLSEVQKEWISAGELRDYLVDRHFRANLVHGSLDEARPAGLLRMLDAGIPVIVERTIKGSNHFQYVCGYEAEKHLVFFMLPEGVGAVSFEKFEKGWALANHLTLVAVPDTGVVTAPVPAPEPPVERAPAHAVGGN